MNLNQNFIPINEKECRYVLGFWSESICLTCLMWMHANDEAVFGFDEAFYAQTYPDAVQDVALGEHENLFAHFLRRGRQLAYRPNRDRAPNG